MCMEYSKFKMGIEEDEWMGILGLRKDDSKLEKILNEKGVSLKKGELREFKDSTLYNLYEDGLSFCFVKDKLDSIDFFVIDKKFKKVKETSLPFGLTENSTGKDLVDIFGEPLEKGGGLNSKMDIWLRWSNLQVEIDDKSWDTAKDTKWKSITIFKD